MGRLHWVCAVSARTLAESLDDRGINQLEVLTPRWVHQLKFQLRNGREIGLLDLALNTTIQLQAFYLPILIWGLIGFV